MKSSDIQRYFFDQFIKRSTIIALLALVLSWSVIVWRILPIKGGITLHYTVHLGIDWIGSSWQALYIPVMGLVLFLINVVLGILVIRKDTMLARLIGGFNIFIQALVLFAAVILVLANV